MKMKVSTSLLKLAVAVLWVAIVVAARPSQASLTAQKALTLQVPTPVYALAFSPDDQTLAGGRQGAILLWNGRGEVTKTLRGIEGNVTGLSFSPDGKTLAAVSDAQGKNFGLWSLDTGELKVTVDTGLPRMFDSFRNVLFSRDGKKIAVSGNSFLLLLNSDTGTVEKKLDGHKLPIQALYFTPKNDLLFSVGATTKRSGTELFSWDLATNQNQGASAYPSVEMPLAVSGNGVLIGRVKQSDYFWNIQEMEPVAQLNLPGGYATKFVLSPDARYVAVSKAQLLELWASDSSGMVKMGDRDVFEANAHAKAIVAMAFSSSGRVLATSALDDTVKLWAIQE